MRWETQCHKPTIWGWLKYVEMFLPPAKMILEKCACMHITPSEGLLIEVATSLHYAALCFLYGGPNISRSFSLSMIVYPRLHVTSMEISSQLVRASHLLCTIPVKYGWSTAFFGGTKWQGIRNGPKSTKNQNRKEWLQDEKYAAHTSKVILAWLPIWGRCKLSVIHGSCNFMAHFSSFWVR